MNTLHTFQRMLCAAFGMAALAIHAQVNTVLPPDRVLAKNQKVTVTYREFEAELARFTPDDRFDLLLSREKMAVLLDNVLLNKTLALEARELKLDKQPHIQAEIANQEDKVLAKYRGQNFQAGLPKVDHLPRAREKYLANTEKYTRPELHDVWHTLVSLQGRTKEQAKARAEEARQKILAGATPESVAKEYSDDPAKSQNSGNIGPYNVATLDPRFSRAVKSMKVGDMIIAETAYGFHVLRLKGITPGVKESFENMKAQLLAEAETEYLVSSWNNYLRGIKNDPKLFVDIEALEAIRPKLPEIPPLPAAADSNKAKAPEQK